MHDLAKEKQQQKTSCQYTELSTVVYYKLQLLGEAFIRWQRLF